MKHDHTQPNILFIMDDQHRFDFLGCMGAEFVRTPNLDRLAASGVRFDRCYTNSPLCAPARIALATGLQPARLGALDNFCYLPPHTTTLYQRFRDNGYRVGCVGKLDLAKPDAYNGRKGDRPCVYRWGFTHPEECEGKMHAGTSPTPLGPYDDPAIIADTRRQYCAAIEAIDAQVGLLLETLERRGFLDNTYIIFTSDHGDMDGNHVLYQKSVAYEPSIHVPLIVSGPDIAGGRHSGAMVELIDVHPTVCELAGIRVAERIDALSFRGVLLEQTNEHRSDIVTSEHNFRCLRNERFKLIENFNDVYELYDIAADPEERNNIADAMPDVVKAMKTRLRQRFMEGLTYRG